MLRAYDLNRGYDGPNACSVLDDGGRHRCGSRWLRGASGADAGDSTRFARETIASIIGRIAI